MLTAVKGRPMNIKTPLAREFEKDLNERLKTYSGQMQRFASGFDGKKHYISAEYYIFTPRSSLFTLDAKISSKAVDLDAHKTFQDVIFKAVGLDDKLVREVKYFSPVSHDDKWNYIVILRLEQICNLLDTRHQRKSFAVSMDDGNDPLDLYL